MGAVVTTSVVNINTLPRDPTDWPADHVYIGRPMPGRGLPPGPWGNPYRVDESVTREDVVGMYEDYLRARPTLLARVAELRGKTLVCWCAPELCHGDLLARLADQKER